MTLANLEKTLLFLTLLFLPTQLGRHFWPQFSFVFSLPIDYLSPTIYFWDLLVVLLIAMWLIGRKRTSKLALNLLLLYILTQLLSLVPLAANADALSLGAGLVRLEQILVAGLFGVYLASANLAQIKHIIFWSLSLSILGESVLAILQFLKGASIGFWILGERTFSLSTPGIAKFDFHGIEFLRPYATFPHPNVLAAFLAVTLPLLNLFNPKSSLVKISMLISGGIATILTVSRVVLVAGFLESLLLLRKKVLLWLMLSLVLISPFLYTRFSAVFNFDNLSFLRREELTGVAWQIFISHPFFGIGLNNFISKASDQLLIGPSRFLQPVHNIFLLSLAETGLVGLVGLLVLIGYPIWRLFKLRTKDSERKTLLIIWSAIIFLGLFDHYFLTLPQGYRLLFLIWGITLSLYSKNAKI